MKHFSPLISIIVPVFNVEKYIEKCLNSIINQTYKKLEIICINDGSTDNSRIILDKFKSIDSRIIIINQKNQGLSVARNIGIKEAQGDLITFVDSDDWLENTAIEQTYRKFINPDIDILCFGAKAKYDALPQKEEDCIKYKNPSIKASKGIWLLSISITAWAKIYRTKFLKANHLTFPEGLYYEDNFFYWQCISCANKIATIKDILYNYRIRENSIMASSNRKGKALDYIYGLDFIYKRWKSNGYLLDNVSLFKWLAEDYARLGHQYLKEKDSNKYKNELIIRENEWKLKYRWGTVPYDTIHDHKINYKKSRLMRSIYKRYILIQEYINIIAKKETSKTH